MKTVEVKVYTFDELPQESKDKVIQEERDNLCVDYVWKEAYESVKEFHRLFGSREGHHSWLEVNTSHIDDNILELSGGRLRTYIMNNFWDSIMTGKYLGHLKLRDIPIKYHRMVKPRQIQEGPDKGKYSAGVYSNIRKEISCPFTGVCYDHSLLDPIEEFVRNPDDTSFKELLEKCVKNLKKDIEDEIEARESDENLIEELKERDDMYYIDGTEFVDYGD